MLHRPVIAVLAILAVSAVPATAQGAGFEKFATASMSGVHKADVGFQRTVGRPKAMRLAIEVEPDQSLNLQYRIQCGRRHPEDWGVSAARDLNHGSGQIRLPIPINRPRTCMVFAYAKYRNASFDGEVDFQLTLLAKQR